jgi:hypothetical protein
MVRSIPLQYEAYRVVAIVDDEDYAAVSGYGWHCSPVGGVAYAYTYAPEYVKMHRLIARAPANMKVHHRNQDGLDNRRGNLQVCTNAEHRTLPHVYIGEIERKGGVWYDPKGQRTIISPERRPYQEALSQERHAHGGSDG